MIAAKENLLRVIHHDNPQWVPNNMEGVYWLSSPAVERPVEPGLDDWLVRHDLEERAQGGTFPAHGGHTITNLTKWREQITIPDVDAMDWGRVEQEARAVDRGEYFVQGIVDYGLFERSYLLLGMDQALVGYVSEPGPMDELVAAIADYKIRLIERFDDVADLDMIWCGDDWGTQLNLFLPPEVWRNILKPHTKRMYDCMKRRKILINQHSCGKIEEILTDIVEIGVDIINPCQPCNDLAALKREFAGRLTFYGGIDSQFVLGRPGVTPEEVRAEVRRRIDEMAAGGGYIACPSQSMPYDPEVQAAMDHEIATYGREVYQNTN